jgi:hypothetical protein
VPGSEPLTITAFSETANYAGEQPGWYAKILKEKLNLTVTIEAQQVAGGGDAVFATKLVSGYPPKRAASSPDGPSPAMSTTNPSASSPRARAAAIRASSSTTSSRTFTPWHGVAP